MMDISLAVPTGIFVGEPVAQPAGTAGPLTGLRIAIKDNIDVAGLPTRAGLGIADAPAAERDAVVVAQLRAAGAAIIGKTNMDEAALGAFGDNPHHGRIPNPRRPGHSPGGSSGGSAAAVASGLADAALGSDTLGSARIPAAYCGVVGLKPSRGLLPLDGVTPLSWSFDTVGILGRDVGTVRRVLGAIVQPTGTNPSPRRASIPHQLRAMTIEPAVREAFDAIVARLRSAGWQIDEVLLPEWNLATLRKAAFLVTEAEGAVVHAVLLQAEDPALSPGVRRLLAYGRDCGSGRVVAAQRHLAGVAATFAAHDLLLMPTTSHTAFAFDGPIPADQADLTAPANVGGQPAISLPIGADDRGLPIGLQLIGRQGEDFALLDAAEAIERLV